MVRISAKNEMIKPHISQEKSALQELVIGLFSISRLMYVQPEIPKYHQLQISFGSGRWSNVEILIPSINFL